MIVQKIPTRSEYSYIIDVALGSGTYTLHIRWNDPYKFWTMDIYSRQMEPVLLGIKLVKEFPLTRRFGLSTLPPYGDLVIVDTGVGGKEPGFDDLGTRFLLCYADWTEEELAKDAELLSKVQSGSIWDNYSSIWDGISAVWSE